MVGCSNLSENHISFLEYKLMFSGIAQGESREYIDIPLPAKHDDEIDIGLICCRSEAILRAPTALSA